MKTLLENYLTYIVSRRFSVLTVLTIKRLLKRLLAYLTGVGVIDHYALTPGHLKDYLATLSRHTTKKGLPLKATFINRNIVAIRGFIKYLAKNGYVSAGLLDELYYLKEIKCLPSSVLSHGRMQRLLSRIPLDHAGGVRDRALLELLYSCGLRVGEVVRLDLTSVDFTGHTLLIFGKGGKERMVPAGKTAMRCLENYVRAVRPYFIKNPSEKALFINREGGRLLDQSVRRIIRQAATAIKTEVPVTPHTFRRSCATELIRGGANLYHVKEMLGHESLDTLKHYVRLTILDLKKTHQKCHPQERETL